MQLQWCYVLLAVMLVTTQGGRPPTSLLLPDRPPAPSLKNTTLEDTNYRLSGDIIPSHYDIIITPVYKTEKSLRKIEKFDGKVTITAEVRNSNDTIELNLKDIDISEVKVSETTEITTPEPTNSEAIPTTIPDKTPTPETTTITTEIPMKNHALHDEIEMVTIKRNDEKYFTEGSTLTIEIKYSGKLNGNSGFHASAYDDTNVLSTQFEATYARTAFPCFDEPSMQATFSLSIEVQDGIDAISNMPGESNDDIIKFAETPKMPTYLLAFLVFETQSYSYTNVTTGDLQFRTYGQSKYIDVGHGDLSQEYGPKMLEFLGDWTNITYESMGFPKMDQAAIPAIGGAMENWGLVIYGEHVLLYNEEKDTEASRKQVLSVIAHELAHQWFGNLVTTSWWDSIWLNEGFANYFQYLVMDDQFRDWRMMERYVLDEQMKVFAVDAESDAYPLTQEVNNPDEISDHFGSITYSKGGSILRQIRNVMGDDFQNGIRAYLQTQSEEGEGLAEPSDLFDNLVKYNKKDYTKLDDNKLREVFEKWTTTPGFPLVTVTLKDNKYEVKQERFSNLTTNEKYPVYLTWMTNKDETPSNALRPQMWLHDEKTTVDAGVDHDWIFFNVHQGGYYRVNYDDNGWKKLYDMMYESKDYKKLAPVDRAAVVDNALALAKMKIINYNKAFKMMHFLREDTDYVPWAAACSGLAYIEQMLGREDSYKKFVRSLVPKVYEEVGFAGKDDDNNVAVAHRVNILTLAGGVGYSEVIKESNETLRELLNESENTNFTTDPNTYALIYCYGLKDGADDSWEKMYATYKAEKDENQRKFYITSLGCTDTTSKQEQFLKSSLLSDTSKAEAPLIFSSVTKNPEGVDAALQFFSDSKYIKLQAKYADKTDSVLKELCLRLTKREDLEKFTEALGDKAKDNFEDEIKSAEDNIKWVAENKDSIVDALKDSTRAGGAATLVSTMLFLVVPILAFLR